MTVALEAGLVGREPEPRCAFYTRIMGFRLVDRLQFDVGTVYKFQRDGARLKIFFSTEAIDPPSDVDAWFRPGGWRYAALSMDRFEDVDALVGAVRASAGRVLREATDQERAAWEAERLRPVAGPALAREIEQIPPGAQTG